MEAYDFYLLLSSNLRTLQTKRLKAEKTQPLELPVYDKHRNTRKARKLTKKVETARRKHMDGYFKGIEDALNVIKSTFKKCSREEERDK